MGRIGPVFLILHDTIQQLTALPSCHAPGKQPVWTTGLTRIEGRCGSSLVLFSAGRHRPVRCARVQPVFCCRLAPGMLQPARQCASVRSSGVQQLRRCVRVRLPPGVLHDTAQAVQGSASRFTGRRRREYESRAFLQNLSRCGSLVRVLCAVVLRAEIT